MYVKTKNTDGEIMIFLYIRLFEANHNYYVVEHGISRAIHPLSLPWKKISLQYPSNQKEEIKLFEKCIKSKLSSSTIETSKLVQEKAQELKNIRQDRTESGGFAVWKF